MTDTTATEAIDGTNISPAQMDLLAYGYARMTPKAEREDPAKAAAKLKRARETLAIALGKGMEIRPIGPIGADGRIITGQFKRTRPRLVKGPEALEKAKIAGEKRRMEAKCKRLPADATREAIQAVHVGRIKRKEIIARQINARVSEVHQAFMTNHPLALVNRKAYEGEDATRYPVLKRKAPTVPFGAHQAVADKMKLIWAMRQARKGDEDAPVVDETTLTLLANMGNTEGAVA